jgi:hypothetical protein
MTLIIRTKSKSVLTLNLTTHKLITSKLIQIHVNQTQVCWLPSVYHAGLRLTIDWRHRQRVQGDSEIEKHGFALRILLLA